MKNFLMIYVLAVFFNAGLMFTYKKTSPVLNVIAIASGPIFSSVFLGAVIGRLSIRYDIIKDE